MGRFPASWREIDGISGRKWAAASAGLTRMERRALTQMGRGCFRETGSAPGDWQPALPLSVFDRLQGGSFEAMDSQKSRWPTWAQRHRMGPFPGGRPGSDQDLSKKSALVGAGVDSDVDSRSGARWSETCRRLAGASSAQSSARGGECWELALGGNSHGAPVGPRLSRFHYFSGETSA
jgi:hypothetical protein